MILCYDVIRYDIYSLQVGFQPVAVNVNIFSKTSKCNIRNNPVTVSGIVIVTGRADILRSQ
jgi:hypothetical protein